ncbi:hypothetical protein IW262DRAFT_1300644 [Armillaria fumosa]|nr:hypothetical protein IW262DRAFT_1300644 [Armillaria fumosa]
MSNHGKSCNKFEVFEVPRSGLTKAALAVLGGHDKRIAESQAELHRVENGLKKLGTMKHKHSGPKSPLLAGTARGTKTHRTKEDMGTKDAAQGGKGKEKAVIHQPTIIIMDSESMASQKFEEPAKKKTAMAFKAARPVEKKKEKTKAPPVDKMGNVNHPSERKKEKIKAIDKGTKGDGSDVDDVKLPSDAISALMSGTQLVAPTRMTNTETTSYMTAIDVLGNHTEIARI